jgi:hypothetical protein
MATNTTPQRPPWQEIPTVHSKGYVEKSKKVIRSEFRQQEEDTSNAP